MTVKDLFLAIDQGGHASRAIIFDRQGRIHAKNIKEVPVYSPGLDKVEHDPEEITKSIECTVTKAINALGKQCKNIVCAGLTTQRSNIVCWDTKTGKALSPIISWQDRRAASWMNQFSQYKSIIHKTTGLFLSAHYGASKLKWCLDHLSSVKKALAAGRLSWGPMASFLIFRLLEQRPLLADPANASRTLLWNLHSLNWDKQLLHLFGLPEKPLPNCVPTRYSFGDLKINNRHIPLKIVTGDQAAALFAYGRPELKTAYINVGTGAFVQRPFSNYSGLSSRLLTSVVMQEESNVTYVLEGTVNGAGSALLKIEEELGVDPAKAQEHLPEWLEKANSPPLFLNGVSGLGAPFWIPDFESRFIGDGENWEKIVGVIESIIFLLQVNMEEMQKLLSPPEKIIISGGLALLDGLCRRLSDISGIPVYRPAEYEAAAKGTAYLLANCPEIWPEAQPGTWFNPKSNPKFNKRYKQWLSYMKKAVLVP